MAGGGGPRGSPGIPDFQSYHLPQQARKTNFRQNGWRGVISWQMSWLMEYAPPLKRNIHGFGYVLCISIIHPSSLPFLRSIFTPAYIEHSRSSFLENGLIWFIHLFFGVYSNPDIDKWLSAVHKLLWCESMNIVNGLIGWFIQPKRNNKYSKIYFSWFLANEMIFTKRFKKLKMVENWQFGRGKRNFLWHLFCYLV